MFLHDQLYFAYYPFVIVAFIYMLFSVGFNRLGLFIVALFWSGMVQFLSELASFSGFPIDVHNIYKIVMALWAIYLFGKEILRSHSRQDVSVNVAWILFSLVFWLSYLKYGGAIITMMSQYLYKYGMVYLLYYGMKSVFTHNKTEYVKDLLLKILFVQVALSVVKIVLSISMTGRLQEFIVGSISSGGAGVAVVLPVSGLVLYWLVKGKKLSGKDTLVSLLFLLIAIGSGKRSPVFIFPVVYLGLAMYATRTIKPGNLLKFIPLAFLAFYLSVRTNWTLNPEKSSWGSFDLEYVYRYVLRYNFGAQEASDIFREDYEGSGRGSGAFLIFQPAKLGLSDIDEYFLGNGLFTAAVRTHGRLLGGVQGYDIDHTGLMGGAAGNTYTLGYGGLIAMLWLSLAILSNVKDKRLRRVLTFFYLWEFFFYQDQFMSQHASVIVVAFACFYDKWQLHGASVRAQSSQVKPVFSKEKRRLALIRAE